MSKTRRRSPVWSLLLAIVAWWAFFHVAAGMLDGDYDARNVHMMQQVATWHGPWLDPLVAHFTQLASVGGMTVLGLITAIGMHRRGHRLDASLLVLLLIGIGALSFGFKLVFQHFRPQIFTPLVHETGFSFPSGHALASVGFFGFMAIWFRQPPRHYRLATLSCIFLALAVPISRVYLGVHWPTDILGGACLGLSWLCLILALRSALPAAEPRHRVPIRRRASAGPQIDQTTGPFGS